MGGHWVQLPVVPPMNKYDRIVEFNCSWLELGNRVKEWIESSRYPIKVEFLPVVENVNLVSVTCVSKEEAPTY